MLDFKRFEELMDGCGMTLSKTEFAWFDRYAQLLVDWNGRMNLTAITEPDDIMMKHFLDSVLLLKYVKIVENASLIDVGSGAGFPGLPLKIVRNDLNVTFLDSLQKRLTFLDAVCEELSLPCKTVHMRAEECGKTTQFREKFDIATARAVARLDILAEYCLPLVRVGGVFAALKGPNEDVEPSRRRIAELGGEISDIFTYELPNSDGRMLVCVRKISQTPTKFPRNSAAIAKDMKK